MKRISRIYPWTAIVGIGFALTLLGNFLFAVNNWQRNIVVSVSDGDSLQLKDGRRIRLLGIDAPERGRCMAGEARAKLVDLALGRHVRLKHTVTDSYGRMLANVLVPDVGLVQSALLAASLGEQTVADFSDLPEQARKRGCEIFCAPPAAS